MRLMKILEIVVEWASYVIMELIQTQTRVCSLRKPASQQLSQPDHKKEETCIQKYGQLDILIAFFIQHL